MKYIADVRRRFREAPAFTIADMKIFLRESGIKPGYLHLLTHKLVARGEVKRIARGCFTFRDEVQVAGFAFRPFYYGLQDALSLRNLWEQESNPVVITPRHVRTGVRQFEGRNYVVRRVAREMFFGFEMLKYGDFWIPVSDPEKTLIDFAYYREHLPQESIKELRRYIRSPVLRDHLRRCTPRVRAEVLRRLGRNPRAR